jgi:hypothetical protein
MLLMASSRLEMNKRRGNWTGIEDSNEDRNASA